MQRNILEENDRIQAGETVGGWSEANRRQKDTDARWTKKGGKRYYCYKNHVNVDSALNGLRNSGNTRGTAWADSAYRSEAVEAAEDALKAQGFCSRIHRKGVGGKALTDGETHGNWTQFKTRCRVEHVFAWMAQWGGRTVRRIGLARAEVHIGFINLVYNRPRFCVLQWVVAP